MESFAFFASQQTEKIPKRKQDLIALFDDRKDRALIPIAAWGGNCTCDDDAEENDEVMGDDFDADRLAVTI